MAAVLGEKQIKRLLTRHLRAEEVDGRARLLSELCVAQFARRADVVLINGHLSAFEIKGERDNLTRLPGQIATYLKHFERVTVVCAPCHTSAVLATVEEPVGVWEVSESGLVKLREATLASSLGLQAWLSYLPVKALIPLLAEAGCKSTGRKREDLLLAASELPVLRVRDAAIRYLRSPQRALKIRQAKTMRRNAHDPVEQHRLRIQEYLRAVATVSGNMAAIPRQRPV
ncbi:sce7726 family protein [Bordetella genomosp. 1]|uniref:sce7726 family protein n=1 Tax=Bordetella genomosp. 1 TaxID=1395607 RepID=UPI001177F5CC|nr:sce7726 family protein [Bordetella genomosp. 1]